VDSLVRDAFHRLAALGELASITACTECARVSTTGALSPVAFRFGLVRPGHFQPQPEAPTPDRRRQPTSATVKEHGHTDRTARTSHGTRSFGAFHRSGSEPELRAARPPELTPRSPEGKAATGRQGSESACATDRAEAHSQPTCRAPLRRFAARPLEVWCFEGTRGEPRPDSIRRANGEDLRQTEVLSTDGNRCGS